MKKIALTLIISACFFDLFAAGADPANKKVLAAFNQSFANAVDVRWAEYLPYYEVNFRQNEMKIKITYDSEGAILRTLRYYSGTQLPILVMTKINKKYSQQKIFGVVEESSEDGVIYHITLVDDKNWIIIKSDDFGDLTTENKFLKG